MRLVSFLFVVVAVLIAPELAFAAEGADSSWGYGIGAGAAIGFAVLGAGIGQGLAVQGATTGIARNPGAAGAIQTPMIVGLAFIESIALFAFVIAFLVQGNIG